MPVAEQICTPLSTDLWDTLSPNASSMDVHNPHEACGCSYNECTDARRPAFECPFFVHRETLHFELVWRRKYKKKWSFVAEIVFTSSLRVQFGMARAKDRNLFYASSPYK